MSEHNLNRVNESDILHRFAYALRHRGFKTAEQLLSFFNSTAEEIGYWLQRGEGRRFVSARLGISNEWLSTGTDHMIVIDQKTWEERQKKKGFLIVSDGKELPLPILITLNTPETKLLLTSDRLSAAEQKAIDDRWDPTHYARDLLLLQHIAEGKPAYGRQHRYQTTVISAARLGLYLALDHDNGLTRRDDLKEAVGELRWHEFAGLKQLIETTPAPKRGILDEYDNVIHICARIVNRVADSLQIRLEELEPKTPLPDWLARAQRAPHKTISP